MHTIIQSTTIMKKSLFLTLTAVLLLASCGSKNDIVITGTLNGGAGKTIYIEEMDIGK